MSMRAEVREAPGGTADLCLVPGVNLTTGIEELARELGQPLTSLEADLLTLTSAVYAADLAFVRQPLENVCRLIEMTVPVVNHAAFEGIRANLEYALHVLTRDAWSLTFTHRGGEPEQHQGWPVAGGTTLLFSGGLDSLAAAVELLDAGVPLTLVSHYTRNPTTSRSQTDLAGYLEGIYGIPGPIRVRVGAHAAPGASFPSAQEREPSQRSRSIVFVAIAAIAARRSGRREIVMMAENGPIAIHLALSTARIGPFSTHTAHPEYLRVISASMSTLLGEEIRVSNPYLYQTKGEVVAPLVGVHDPAIALAVSCWQASRVATDHCGYCIPCLVRRVALETHGYAADQYARDLLSEDLDAIGPDDDGLRNLADLVEFAARWNSAASTDELTEAFLELHNADVDGPRAVDMYRRFSAEVLEIVGRYPTVVRRLLS